MNEWVAVWQALSAMDAVRRRWARELRIEPAELAVVMLLSAGESLGPADIAWRSGRARQQEFRTLRTLFERRLVKPARRSDDGMVMTWRLSNAGVSLARRVEARAGAWTRMLSAHVNVSELMQLLQRTMRVLVNQPSTHGWQGGLCEPRECRELDFALSEAGVQDGVTPSPDADVPFDLKENSTKLRGGEGEGVSAPVIVADGFAGFAAWCDSDDPMAAFWRALNR